MKIATKSRKRRRVYVKTPGSKTVVHIRARKPSHIKCSACGSILSGVPRISAAKMKDAPKSQKKPSRPYGGNLCSKCMRKKMVEAARK